MDIKYSPSGIYELLNETNTLISNRYLVHAIGNAEATIYGALLAKYKYYCENKQEVIIEKEGFFYSTIPDLHKSTGYGEKAQARAIKHLQEVGLIETRLMSIGTLSPKRHIKIIDDSNLINQLLQKGKEVEKSIDGNYQQSYQRISEWKKSKNTSCQDKKTTPPLRQNGVVKTTTTDWRSQLRRNSVADYDEMADKSISNKSISIKSKSINQSKEVKSQKQKEKNDMIDTIDFEYAMEEIKEHILYDSLIDEYPSEKETVDLIINLLTEIKISKKKTTRVNGQNLATEMVQNMFLSLDFLHIEYVLDSLKKNTTEIKNMKAYLTTSLYNAPLTYETYIQAQVNHDMAQPSFYQSSCPPEINSTVPVSDISSLSTTPTQVVQEEQQVSADKELSSNKSIEPISQASLVTTATEQDFIIPPTFTQTPVEETEIEELPEKHLRTLATMTLLVSDIKDQEIKNQFIKQLDKEVPSWRTSKNSNAKRLQDKLLSA